MSAEILRPLAAAFGLDPERVVLTCRLHDDAVDGDADAFVMNPGAKRYALHPGSSRPIGIWTLSWVGPITPPTGPCCPGCGAVLRLPRESGAVVELAPPTRATYPMGSWHGDPRWTLAEAVAAILAAPGAGSPAAQLLASMKPSDVPAEAPAAPAFGPHNLRPVSALIGG